MRPALASLALLALAACGNPTPKADDPVSEHTPGEPSEVAAPMPKGEGVGTSDDIQAVLDDRIPTRFHGVWDYVGGSCDPASDMRMEISGSEILFYESIGIVTGVEPEGDAVIVSLAMEGEGETWEQDTRLVLVGEGDEQRLETSEAQKAHSDDYPQKRCPA